MATRENAAPPLFVYERSRSYVGLGVLFALLAGSVGGAGALLLWACQTNWLLGAQPAMPTFSGYSQLAIAGALSGGFWGAFAVVLVYRIATWRWSGLSACLLAVALALVVGALMSMGCISIHVPIDLQIVR